MASRYQKLLVVFGARKGKWNFRPRWRRFYDRDTARTKRLKRLNHRAILKFMALYATVLAVANASIIVLAAKIAKSISEM